MFKRMRARITFSNVIAIMALFFALGGTVYAAAKINGKQIKSGSIPGNRIKKNSLTGNQINETALKTPVSYVSASQALDSTVVTPYTVTATCPSGQFAVGGGTTQSDQTNGGFTDDGNFTPDHTGWVVHEFSGSVNSTVTVTVACVA